MSTFVFDCPCCSAKNSTFDMLAFTPKPPLGHFVLWNLFSKCRACEKSCCISGKLKPNLSRAIMNINARNGDLDSGLNYISELFKKIKVCRELFDDLYYAPILPKSENPPEHLPSDIEEIYKEGANCFSIGCFNAAGAMFRLCLDTTTKNILSKNEHLSPTSKDKNTIHSRLNWIFNNGILPKQLEDLSRCIKDDGNDAAHDGSLCKEDAADLLDFTYILLERIYTEPARIENAQQRRVARRQA